MPLIYPKVTAERIAKGGHDCLCCPVVLAVAAELPAGRKVLVYAHEIYIDGRPYPTPVRVERFVRAFDAPVRDAADPDLAPFAFVLWVEESAMEPVKVYEEAA